MVPDSPIEKDGTQLPASQLTSHRTVAGLFAERAQAEQAVDELQKAGFAPEQIGVAQRDAVITDETPALEYLPTAAATGGAVSGGLLGGALGLLAGVGLLAIPGVGPVLAGGLLASVFAGVGLGAAGGSLLGALVGTGLSEDEARHFESGLQSGAVLVSVHTAGRAQEALSILRQLGADTGASVDATVGAALAASEEPPAVSQPLPVDKQRIELRAEELSIHKQKVDLGEVTVRKEVITETQLIEVPVRREELVVERQGAEGGPPTESLRILLNEEQVNFEKKLVVLEEVDISKREVTEMQRIDETLRREELHIENEGTEPNPPGK